MKYYAIGGAALVVILVGVMATMSTTEPTGNVVATQQEGVQEVLLTMDGMQYRTEPSVLKAGVPVRMTVDLATVTGCMRDVVIPAFDVRKLVSEGDNVIEFTPKLEGQYPISCSMGMGQGTLVVGESQVELSANVASKSATCGLEGECGCH